MSAFDSVVLATWIVFWVYWFISALLVRSKTKHKESFAARWLYWILYICGYIVLLSGSEVFGPLSSRFLPDDIALRLVGIMVLLLGLSFAVWARVHLGQYWSGRVSIKVDHKLIRSGPYRLVRHPIYTGILFGFIGTALEVGEIRAWLAFVLALVGLLIKIRAEERLLVKEFGSTYLQYKKEVKMLIPYLV